MEDLTKVALNKLSAVDLKNLGNKSFSSGEFDNAINLYSQGIIKASEDDKATFGALLGNRC